MFILILDTPTLAQLTNLNYVQQMDWLAEAKLDLLRTHDNKWVAGCVIYREPQSTTRTQNTLSVNQPETPESTHAWGDPCEASLTSRTPRVTSHPQRSPSRQRHPECHPTHVRLSSFLWARQPSMWDLLLTSRGPPVRGSYPGPISHWHWGQSQPLCILAKAITHKKVHFEPNTIDLPLCIVWLTLH